MLGFGFDKVKGLGDGNFFETIDVSRFWVPKKLKLDWLAKRMGSDAFTIRGAARIGDTLPHLNHLQYSRAQNPCTIISSCWARSLSSLLDFPDIWTESRLDCDLVQ